MKLIRGSKFDLPFIVSKFPEIMGGIDTTKINLEGREFHICEDSCRETPEGFIICISGGLNGRGIWSNYFEILGKLLFQIELRFPDVIVDNLKNDMADDVFYLDILIPADREEKTFSKVDNREKAPKEIVEKVKKGEGVVHKINGKWRIVSVKANPPRLWNAVYDTEADAKAGLAAYHKYRH